MQAAHEHDVRTLWSLTEAWLRSYGSAGASVSANTVRNYHTGVRLFLEAWVRIDLLHPDLDAATSYLRQPERRGLAPATTQGRLTAARGLYAALRWAHAVSVDPFTECRPPRDMTPAWEKRMPYADDEVAALLQAATDPADHCHWLCFGPYHTGQHVCPDCSGRVSERSASLSANTIAKGEQGRNRSLPAATRRPDRCAPCRTERSALLHAARAGMALAPRGPRIFPPAPTRCGRCRTRVVTPAGPGGAVRGRRGG